MLIIFCQFLVILKPIFFLRGTNDKFLGNAGCMKEVQGNPSITKILI